jgi:hypothetical protein
MSERLDDKTFLDLANEILDLRKELVILEDRANSLEQENLRLKDAIASCPIGFTACWKLSEKGRCRDAEGHSGPCMPVWFCGDGIKPPPCAPFEESED